MWYPSYLFAFICRFQLDSNAGNTGKRCYSNYLEVAAEISVFCAYSGSTCFLFAKPKIHYVAEQIGLPLYGLRNKYTNAFCSLWCCRSMYQQVLALQLPVQRSYWAAERDLVYGTAVLATNNCRVFAVCGSWRPHWLLITGVIHISLCIRHVYLIYSRIPADDIDPGWNNAAWVHTWGWAPL